MSASSLIIGTPERRSTVGYDLSHVSVLTKAVMKKIRKDVQATHFGLVLDYDRLAVSVEEQISALVELATFGSAPYNLHRFEVIAALAPLIKEIFPAKAVSDGNTVKLSLARSQSIPREPVPSNPILQETGVQTVSTVDSAPLATGPLELWARVNEIGLDSGLATTDLEPGAGGNYHLLLATADWDGDDCVVYHTGPLSPSALLIVAALNVQGKSKFNFMTDSHVNRSLVVSDGVTMAWV